MKVNPKLDLIYKTLPEDDPTQRKPLIEIAKKKLNWEPNVALDIGLDNTIHYFKKELNLLKN